MNRRYAFTLIEVSRSRRGVGGFVGAALASGIPTQIRCCCVGLTHKMINNVEERNGKTGSVASIAFSF